MIKDLSAKLVAAAAAINQKSREAYVAEQRQIEEAKNLKAKHASMMPKQPEPKADPAAVPAAKKMAEAVEGSVPKTPKEKELAAKSGNKSRITFGDVLKARGVKMKEEVEELDEVDQLNSRHQVVLNKTPSGKAREILRNREHLKSQMKSTKSMGGLAGPKGRLPEEFELGEAINDNLHPAGAALLKHIKPEHRNKYKEHLTTDVFTGSHKDRTDVLNAAKNAGHLKEDAEAVDENWDAMMKDSRARSAAQGTGKFDIKKRSTGTEYTRKSSTFEDGGKDADMKKADKKAKSEGFMDTMKKMGKKVVDTVTHGDDVDLIKDLQKKVGVPQTGVKPKPAKPVDTKPKMAHDYVKEDIEQIDELSKTTLGAYAKAATRDAVIKRKTAADFEHQGKRAKSPGMKAASNEISQRYKEKSWKRRDGIDKAVDRLTKEEFECLEVQHEQFGLGKTLGQFSEDLSRVDVMFAEGIKRVSIDEIEMVEETAAIHPSAIHVSPASNGKYKVHAVGKKFASGIKVGEHLTDTHLDDFSEMGGKIKMVKAPKKD